MKTPEEYFELAVAKIGKTSRNAYTPLIDYIVKIVCDDAKKEAQFENIKYAEKILRKHLTDEYYDAWDKEWHLENCPIDAPTTTVVDVIQAAMVEYAQEVVKKLNIPAVINCVPYQICPKCNGDGDLCRHHTPAIVGTVARPICDVCGGNKIIPMAHCL